MANVIFDVTGNSAVNITPAAPATLTINTTLGTVGQNLLWISVAWVDDGIGLNGTSLDTVTVDGVAATLYDTSTGNAVYYFLVSSGGNHTVTVTAAGDGGINAVIGFSSYKNVDPANPMGTSAKATGSTSPITVNVTGKSPTNIVVDSASCGQVTTLTASGNQRWNTFYLTRRGAGQDKTSTNGAVTMSWTQSLNKSWSIIAGEINAVPTDQTLTGKSDMLKTTDKTLTGKGRVLNKRYWVGNGGAWSSTSHWAATSGGASGASVPSSNTIVYFDANSFSSSGQTVTLGFNRQVWSIDFTGVTNNPTVDCESLNGPLIKYNSIFTGMTWSNIGSGQLSCSPPAGTTMVLTTNGITMPAPLMQSGTTSLGDALTATGFTMGSGAFTSNGYAMTISGNATGGSGTANLDGTIMTLSGIWYNVHNSGLFTVIFTGAMIDDNDSWGPLTTTIPVVQLPSGTHTLQGDMTCDVLELKAGCTLKCGYGSVSTITLNGSVLHESIISIGTSGSHIIIEPDTTYQTYFNLVRDTGGTVASYTDIYSCHASGGADFIADSTCTDQGGNTGWQFQNAGKTLTGKGRIIAQRYWVGGSGRWNPDDPSSVRKAHWSTISGGSGGATEPDAYTDAIFDSNSFTAAGQTVDTGSPLCHNLIVDGVFYNPTFSAVGNYVFVSGYALVTGGTWTALGLYFYTNFEASKTCLVTVPVDNVIVSGQSISLLNGITATSLELDTAAILDTATYNITTSGDVTVNDSSQLLLHSNAISCSSLNAVSSGSLVPTIEASAASVTVKLRVAGSWPNACEYYSVHVLTGTSGTHLLSATDHSSNPKPITVHNFSVDPGLHMLFYNASAGELRIDQISVDGVAGNHTMLSSYAGGLFPLVFFNHPTDDIEINYVDLDGCQWFFERDKTLTGKAKIA